MNNYPNPLNDHEGLLDLALVNIAQNSIDGGSLPSGRFNMYGDISRVKVFGELELLLLKTMDLSN